MAKRTQHTVTVPWDLGLFVEREARQREVPKSLIYEEALREYRRRIEQEHMRRGYEELDKLRDEAGLLPW